MPKTFHDKEVFQEAYCWCYIPHLPPCSTLTWFTLSQQVAAQLNWYVNTILTMLFVYTAR